MKLSTLFVGACLVAAVLPALPLAWPVAATRTANGNAAAGTRPKAVEWPTHFRARPLTQLALTPLEERFAERLPGAIARFTDGRNVLIVRRVTQATRQLHPAVDCFRAAGFSVEAARSHKDATGVGWNCFGARRDGRSVRVCERLYDEQGHAWTDVSAWYWAALWAARSSRVATAPDAAGPWWAITVVMPLGDGLDAP